MKSKETIDLEKRLEASKLADNALPGSKLQKRPNEVSVTQYLRPDGRKREMYAPVGEEYVKIAEEKDLIIGAEDLGTGQIALYVRRSDEDEEQEKTYLATNSPGENEPVKVLQRAIEAA